MAELWITTDDEGNEWTCQPPSDCPGCGAPAGYPPAGPCDNHGTAQARASDKEHVKEER